MEIVGALFEPLGLTKDESIVGESPEIFPSDGEQEYEIVRTQKAEIRFVPGATKLMSPPLRSDVYR